MKISDDKHIISKIVKIPIYNVMLEILIHETSESFSDSIGENGKKYDSVTYEENGNLFIHFDINAMSSYKSQMKMNSIIVHEAIHLKNFVFDLVNIKNDLDNDEPETYLTQFIFEELYQSLEKYFIS